jgi:hypothetical protein
MTAWSALSFPATTGDVSPGSQIHTKASLYDPGLEVIVDGFSGLVDMLGQERDFVVDPANPHGHRPVVRLEKIDADNRGGLEGDPNLDFPVAFFDTLDCPPGDTCPIGQLLNRKLAPLAAKPNQLAEQDSGLVRVTGICPLLRRRHG